MAMRLVDICLCCKHAAAARNRHALQASGVYVICQLGLHNTVLSPICLHVLVCLLAGDSKVLHVIAIPHSGTVADIFIWLPGVNMCLPEGASKHYGEARSHAQSSCVVLSSISIHKVVTTPYRKPIDKIPYYELIRHT